MWPGLHALVVFIIWEPFVHGEIRGMRPGTEPPLCNGAPIDPSIMNDNFCDCEIDEPLTEACAGAPSAKFYCKNEGSEPKFIPSSRVNDHICDCCDSSDESVELCPNTCAAEGESYRRRLAEEAAITEQALIRQNVLNEKVASDVVTREALIKEKQEASGPLKATLEHCDAEVAQLEETVNLAKKAREEAETAKKEGEVENEDIAAAGENLAEEHKKVDDTQQATEGEAETAAKADEEQKLSEYAKWADKDAEHFHKDEKPNAEEQADGPDDDQAIETSETSDPHEVALAEAKKKQRAAKHAYDDMQNTISNLQHKIHQSRELGKFASLMDECFSVSTEGFNYKVCFFDKATQDGTNIGKWDKMEESSPELPTEAIFSHGTVCPGGVHRSLIVEFMCGAAEELVEVLEPSMCKYAGKMKHPAACKAPSDGHPSHEEL